jgi:eukaryotic-like serine/threonine-protein kinase
MTAEFTTGQHIGDYEIQSILGAGGMGKVYRVRNVISDRIEAMKILLPDLTSNQGLADRFLREIRLLATLNHPNIAALRTALTFQNQLVMIMEFVEGETLSNRIARAPISTAEAVKFSDQVLSALSYAHKQNIIHRDIKPANMMLTSQGMVKLMDFGIARSTSEATGGLTSTGTTLGSLNYMPPEQVRGEVADARSDIYAFGVSLYELLTGKLPFQSDSQYSLMTKHLNEPPPAPIMLRKDIPPTLNEIIMIAMAKDPSQRFQSADAFRAALQSVPVSSLPSSDTTMTETPRPSSGMPQPTNATTLVETPLPPRVSTVAAPPRTPAPAPAAAGAAAPPFVPEVAPAAPARSSGRGLWVAIGALVGVGVLIAAGVYIPRRVGTHADPTKNAPASVAVGGSNTPTTSGTASQPAVDSPISIQTDKGSIKVDPQGNVDIQVPQASISTSPTTGVKVTTKNGGNPQPARSNNPGQPAQNAEPAAPPVPPGPSPEEIAKMEDEADKLNVRASTVSQSIDTLRQQQMAAGYNLRADMSSAEQRMQMYLAKGNDKLKVQDLAGAQKYFDLAEVEITKLEKFMGR